MSLNVGDLNTIKKIIKAILIRDHDIKYVFYDNFEVNKDMIENILLDTLNKFVVTKKIKSNFYTQGSAIFLNVGETDDLVITHDRIYKINNFYGMKDKKIDENSVTLTNIITSILQYDFSIKYKIINFEQNLENIKRELVKRINLNEFHNIYIQEYIPRYKSKLKNPRLHFTIIDKSKKDTRFNIIITDTCIII